MSKRIILLGSRGMLGQMVKGFFNKEGYEVIIYNKRFEENSIHKYFDEINSIERSVVINCIGRIKQKSDNAYDLLLSNTIFPIELSRSLKADHLLIHPSTDCVFDGISEVPYLVSDKHTAKDFYGTSKSMGETAITGRGNSLVVRVSLIGPDINSNSGLFAWFLSNSKGAKINGYTNHFWNGITTLEWCERINSCIKNKELLNNLLKEKIIQLGTDKIYSKYELLCMFNKLFDREVIINASFADTDIYRCLKPDIVSPALEHQLINLKNYLLESNL